MVGTDIIEVARIENLIKEKGDKFLNKIYTQREIDYCESKGPNKYFCLQFFPNFLVILYNKQNHSV